MNEAYVMHPRYNQFLEFMQLCPHRKSAECLQTAFWVWLKMVTECEYLLLQSEATEDVNAI